MAIPDGYGTVTPWIISGDTAQLIDFAKRAFVAEELARLPGVRAALGTLRSESATRW